MTFEEYCKHREDHTFTWEQVVELLDRYGYRHKTIHTLVDPGQDTWLASDFKSQEGALKKIREMYEGEIPFYFTYIKFYKSADGSGPFALVAGKSNLGDETHPENPDFEFEIHSCKKSSSGDCQGCQRKRKDKAKRWLGCPDHPGEWYAPRVLAVWETGQELWRNPGDVNLRVQSPQARHALAVEEKIRDLFGLFKS